MSSHKQTARKWQRKKILLWNQKHIVRLVKRKKKTPRNTAFHFTLGTCWQIFNKTSTQKHLDWPLSAGDPRGNQPSQGLGRTLCTLFLSSSSRTMEVIVNLRAMLLDAEPAAGTNLGVCANLTWACQSSLRPQPLVGWSLQLSPHPWFGGYLNPARNLWLQNIEIEWNCT